MNDMTNAFANGRAWYASICDMVQALETAEADRDSDATDAARQQIEESPLSVMVRDGWHMPGQLAQDGPEEYEILLSTGGPALRIVGELGRYWPATAELQAQDWGTSWTRVPDCDEQKLLSFACCFWFGE